MTPSRAVPAGLWTRLSDALFRMIEQTADPARIGRYRAANAALVAASDPRPRIVFISDSIADLWPGLDRLAPAGAVIVGRGIAGQTSTQMLLRFQADVVGVGAAAVVILAGSNDIRADFSAPVSVGEAALARISANVTAMADIAKGRGIAVAICALPPLAAPFKGRKPSVARRDPLVLASVNAWLRVFAASRGAPFVDFHTLLVNSEGRFTRDLTDDGLHPNAAGYQKMGEALAPILAILVAGPGVPTPLA